MRRIAAFTVLSVIVASASAREARAFCGFYVAGADAKLFNDASQVVLMRDGTRTVLSMQNNYKGPPTGFAMVVPVPVILEKANVKTLPRAVFDTVDRLTAPRLVEYWEEDPCAPENDFGKGGLGKTGIGPGGGGAGAVEKKDLGVTVEAKFEVGEYQIVILSAKDSTGLDTWLRQERYAIPKDAAPYLVPYVQAGSKFFVAKVDPAKVKFEDGQAQLSPLRFHYDSPELTLPVRLGLINSSGTQDLIINVLGKRQRFEPANYRTLTIPTNLDLAEEAKGDFGRFYAALFDRTLEKNPRAIVTEYAWDASTCDPCPGPALTGSDLATLGADALTGGARISAARLDDSRDAPFAARMTSRVRGCHSRRLENKPDLAGKMEVKVSWENGVSRASIVRDEVKDADLAACVTSVLGGDKGEGTPSTMSITFETMPELDVRSWTITRLHARYSRDALGPDIVFRAAHPIAGGREVRVKGALEHGSMKAPSNNFQARYASRHPWTGKVECKEPKRGRWGGPPDAVPATKIAFAPRGGLDLTNVLRSDVPEIDLRASVPQPVASAPPTDAGPDAGPMEGAGKKGCGSCGIGVLVALYAGRRRKRER